MKYKDLSGWGCVGLMFFFAVCIVVGAYIWMWSSVTMWGWFVTPITSIPAPSMATFYGLWLFVSLFKARDTTTYTDKDASDIVGSVLVTTFYPLLVVGIGWIVLQFV